MNAILKTLILCLSLIGVAVHAKGNGNNGNGNSGNGNGPNPGPGLSSAGDVKLNSIAATQYALVQHQQINPIQSTAGFSTAFLVPSGTSSWTQAATVEGSSLTDKVASDYLSFSFAQASGGTSGTWSVTNTNTQSATLDLVLSFHAGDNVGSFLFNDQTIVGGQTLNGTWTIQWLNNAGAPDSIPTFSNMAFYTGPVQFTTPVPEPATYGMLLGGLGLIGLIARRRRQA